MSKKSDPYRVGLVGGGNISRLHLDGMSQHPDRVKVVALCDPNRENAEKRAADYKIEQTYSNLEEMIEQANLDIAIVCTPTPVRKQVVLPLIEARIPVLCEKPLSETYAEAKEIEQAAREAGIAVAVNQNLRRRFSFSVARGIIEAGGLGRPLHLMHNFAGIRRDKGWRLQRKRYVMAVMSIHWFDGYRYLLQDEPIDVYCRRIKSPAIDGGEDTAGSLILHFRKGTIVNLSESFSSFTSPKSCSLDCEVGGLRLDFESLEEIRSDGQSIEHTNPFKAPEPTYWLLNDLIESIESAREPETSASDNIKSIRILEAAYRSAEENHHVNIEEIQ